MCIELERTKLNKDIFIKIIWQLRTLKYVEIEDSRYQSLLLPAIYSFVDRIHRLKYRLYMVFEIQINKYFV